MGSFRIKIDTLKSLEFLDLKLPLEKKYKRLKDNSLIRCNFQTGDHSFHGNDPQLNTNTDLLIIIGENLQRDNSRILNTLDKLEKTLEKQEKIINKIEKNLDFLKSQQEEINRKIIINSINLNIDKINKDLKDIKEIILS